ncbi:MAG: hypothetical protein OXN21_01075 [Chloroflexota bacterium]|nr:hypothetical protein [Chloroflexota bacterium]
MAELEKAECFEREVPLKPPEIRNDWLVRELENPHYTEPQDDGRIRYYGVVPELGHWIRVIVEEGKVYN